MSNFFVHESSYIDPGCTIGDGTKIWHFCHILSGAKIGSNCIISQNVMIDRKVQIGNRCKIQNNVSLYSSVQLEDDIFCGPSCVFTNVRFPRAAVERKDEFLPTLVKKGATIGANATIVPGVTLGENCFIGAGSVVLQDVPPYACVVGNPARWIHWQCQCGESLPDSLHCHRCNSQYRLNASQQLEKL